MSDHKTIRHGSGIRAFSPLSQSTFDRGWSILPSELHSPASSPVNFDTITNIKLKEKHIIFQFVTLQWSGLKNKGNHFKYSVIPISCLIFTKPFYFPLPFWHYSFISNYLYLIYTCPQHHPTVSTNTICFIQFLKVSNLSQSSFSIFSFPTIFFRTVNLINF